MKTLAVLLSLAFSAQTFALTIDLNGQSLNPEIVKYLEKKLVVCTLDRGDEVMTVEKITVREDHVDNGITDLYYTIDITYDAVRNDQTTNDIRVNVLDSDFDNWREYEEKLSFEITYDRHKFCN